MEFEKEATGRLRKPNVGKKKCLCALGVMADCIPGVKWKQRGSYVLPYIGGREVSYKEIVRFYDLTIDEWDIVTMNDDHKRSLTSILKELFNENSK